MKFLNSDVFVTASIDQRIVTWQVTDTAHDRAATSGDLKQLACFTHNVADVSSLGVYHTRSVRITIRDEFAIPNFMLMYSVYRNGAALLLCGIGLQCYFIQGLETASTV